MILLTGGTGFVGRYIVKRLVNEKVPTRCLVRSTTRASVLSGTELCEGDITKPETLEPAMQGVEAVIHLVGIRRQTKRVRFDQAHVQGTRNVVVAAKKAGVKKFVHMSSMGTRADGKSDYHKSKWEAEEVVRNSGLTYVIFRPSIILGVEDEFVNMFAKMMRLNRLFMPVIGTGNNLFQPIHVEEVSLCFLRAAIDPNIKNKTYELGGEKVSMNQVLKTIAKVKGYKRAYIHIPLGLFKVMLPLMGVLPNPPIVKDEFIMLQEENAGDNSKMKKDFGFEPMKFEEAIRTYLSNLSKP